MPRLLLGIYKDPTNIFIHLFVMLAGFTLVTAFEYYSEGMVVDALHAHRPDESGLLFATLFLFALFVVLQKILFERNVFLSKKAKLGNMATLISTVTVGCMSCGTAVLIPIASIFGLSGLLLALPFEGLEIQVLGIALLLVACLLILKKLQRPNVCVIN